MRSAMSALRAQAKQEAINRAVENAQNRLCSFPESAVRLSTLAAKRFLLDCPTLVANGVFYSTQVRNIGAGVKEVYLEKKGEAK